MQRASGPLTPRVPGYADLPQPAAAGQHAGGGLTGRLADLLDEVPAIGRERLLGELTDLVKAVAGGRGRACLVTGEAGVGKTRLLREVLTRARLLECHVLYGRAQDYDHSIAYAVLSDLLASASEDTMNPETRAQLSALRSVSEGTAFGDEIPAGQPSPYALTTRLLRNLSQLRPCVIVVDDAHLADGESLTALCLAARHLRTHPVLFVFAARTDHWTPGTAFAATVGRLVEDGAGTTVELEPLDEADIKAFVGAALDGTADGRLARYVYMQSRGNPLFARECLMSLKQRGALRGQHGRYYLAGDPDPGFVSQRGALLHRVFQQDAAGRQLARVMSAFRRVRLDQLPLLSDLTGLSPALVQQAFDSLTDAAIVVKVDASTYHFAHPLIAEVLYNDLGPVERRSIHAAISAHASQDGRARIGFLELAGHLVEAASPGDQAPIAAALQAASVTRDSAPLSAAKWLTRALELMDPGSPEVGTVLAWQTTAFWKGSRPEFAVESGTRAIERLPAGRIRAATLAAVVNAHYAMGSLNEALKACAAVPEADLPPAVLAQRSVVLAYLGRVGEADAFRARARQALEQSGPEEQAIGYSYLGHAENCAGTYENIEYFADQLWQLGGAGNQTVGLGARLSALESGALMLSVCGDAARAEHFLDEVAKLTPRAGWHDIGGQVVYATARIQFLRGNWSSSLDTVRDGAVGLEFAGFYNNLAWLRLVEVEILLEQGLHVPAEEVLNSLAVPAELEYCRAVCECFRARIALARNDVDSARLVLKDQAEAGRRSRWHEVSYRALEMLISISLSQGESCRARRLATELAQVAEETGRPKIIISADLALAEATGDPDLAERALLRSESSGIRLAVGRAHFALATLGRDPGVHLHAASVVFDEIGARAWAKRVASHARTTGVHLERDKPDTRQAGVEALADTEVQLLQLVRDGLNNREIAEAMHYSRKTIEAYLTRLYRKAGATSRVGLVLAAERQDWLAARVSSANGNVRPPRAGTGLYPVGTVSGMP
jgi:DNA-binding CsgD family transcriptional regulator